MSNKKKLTISDLQKEIIMLEKVTNALNTAVVALAYATKIKGNELDKVTSEEYVDYVTKHVHPLVIRGDELVAETAKKAAEELKKGDGDGD